MLPSPHALLAAAALLLIWLLDFLCPSPGGPSQLYLSVSFLIFLFFGCNSFFEGLFRFRWEGEAGALSVS